jgi:gluconolactonase
MYIKIINGLLLLFILSSCKSNKNTHVRSIQKIEVFDHEMLSVVDTSSIIEVLADGFTWSEGPLWLNSENMLIFTDVPENRIYSWDEKNGKRLYLYPSGFTINDTRGGKEGANGLALNANNELILCQHGNRTVAKMLTPLSSPKDSFQFLTQKFNDKRYNSPNDLHIAKNGDIFFTDPPYGLPGQDQDSIKELKFNGVYKLSSDGVLTLLDSTLTSPNGIALSLDEKILYVANSDPEKAIWKKYLLDDNKKIISNSLFADKTWMVAKHKGLPDGLKISRKGYVFATGPGGVLVFSPNGSHLGTFNTGYATANCALDHDESYLYMTAYNYLMRVKLRRFTGN